MAGFVLWERESEEEGEEVKGSEAHTFGVDGSTGYGSTGGG